MTPQQMTQTAPYPAELAELVSLAAYRPGWRIRLVDDCVRDPADTHSGESRGLTLIITTLGYDTYHVDQGQTYGVNHFFAVPPSTWNRTSWQRWLFERVLDVEKHEAMEFFQIDGARPYAPNHGPGEDVYTVHDPTTDEARRTSFRGIVKT